MSVENDGLPPTEAAVHEPDDGPLDPPTDLLPLDAASATKVAAADAAARKAEADAAAATRGSMEGDLFDGQ
jgi:hypothetical protein